MDAFKAHCLIRKEYITFSKGNTNYVYYNIDKQHKHVMEKEEGVDY